jgi:uncharacterized LabA/DUF88 family protein
MPVVRKQTTQESGTPINIEVKTPNIKESVQVKIDQSIAVLIDGNNIEYSMRSLVGDENAMINFDLLIPELLKGRSLKKLIYFREGKSISPKLAERLRTKFYGTVMPCLKSADIPITIKAVQFAPKVDTIILMSGDKDFVELIRHLKSEGVRVEVAGIDNTTAHIVKEEADYFFGITKDYSFVLK